MRLSSLFLVLAIVAIRFFNTALWPSDLAIQTEDKSYLLQAGETWGVYFKHVEKQHPFLATENMASIQLENEVMGMELSIDSITSETLMNQTHVTLITFAHPFQSTLVPILFENPVLTFNMVDGSRLRFDLDWVGIFPEKESFHPLPFSELFGLYAKDRLGLQGLYLTLENPNSLKRCIRSMDVGLGPISPSHIYQTSQGFVPHQPLDEYAKGPFERCIDPYETIHLLLELTLTSVLETIPITLEFEDGTMAYLEPVRLVRNIPFHHDMPIIEGQFYD